LALQPRHLVVDIGAVRPAAPDRHVHCLGHYFVLRTATPPLIPAHAEVSASLAFAR
jgi:hypothetical protein